MTFIISNTTTSKSVGTNICGKYDMRSSSLGDDEATYPPARPVTSALFTFQRRNGSSSASGSANDSTVCKTTLNTKIVGNDEESMEDIVKWHLEI
jgi:hypothetical protein